MMKQRQRASAAKNRRERKTAVVEPRKKSNVKVNGETVTIQPQVQHPLQPLPVIVKITNNLDRKKTRLLGSMKDLTINNNNNDMNMMTSTTSPKRKLPPETVDLVDDNEDMFSLDGDPFEVNIDFDDLDRALDFDEEFNDNNFKRRKVWEDDAVGGDDLSQIDVTGFLDMMKKSTIAASSTAIGSKDNDLESLQSRGLQHFDLSQRGSSSQAEEINEIYINLDIMSELMMSAVTSLQYPFLNPYEHPVDVDTICGLGRERWSIEPNLAEECRAILLLVANYCLTNTGSPHECVKALFPDFETIEPGPSDGDCKTWRLLAIAGSIDLPYFRWLCEEKEMPGGESSSSSAGSTGFWRVRKWARRMSKITSLSLGSDKSHYALRKVGYILGFWMAKLFMEKDPSSAENLPNELLYTKERFLEIYGHQFENAMIFPMPF